MKLRQILPLASLATLCAVLAISALHDEPLGMEFTVPPQDADIPDVDLGLGVHTLHGFLVDEQGQPVAEAGVTTEQGGRPIWTWSGEDGGFTLNELRPGPLLLRVVALNFEASTFSAVVDGRASQGLPGSGAPLTFTLDRPIGDPPLPPPLVLGDVTGSVSFGPLARPELGYELLFQPSTAPTDPSGGFPRRVRVAADGSFSVDLLHAGEYRVILLSPDDRGGRGPDLLQRADESPRTMIHETGGDSPRLELVATMGAVTGTIVSSVTPETSAEEGLNEPPPPTPIRGALVKIERVGESEQSAETWRKKKAMTDTASASPAAGTTDPEGMAQNDETVNKVTFRAVRSDESGDFLLHDLSPGRYRLTLVAGRERRTRTITVPERGVTTVDVDLKDR